MPERLCPARHLGPQSRARRLPPEPQARARPVAPARGACALADPGCLAGQNNYPDEILPHLRSLSRHALGSYRILLGEGRPGSPMGKLPGPGQQQQAQQRRRRQRRLRAELLQLFSIGLVKSAWTAPPSSTPPVALFPPMTKRPSNKVGAGADSPGWTYAGSGSNNWENFSGPLVPRDVNHDMRAKRLPGLQPPRQQSTQADAAATIDCVFAHPNVPPFAGAAPDPRAGDEQPLARLCAARGQRVCQQRQRPARATSKPRCAPSCWTPEARNGTASATTARLRDPISASPPSCARWAAGSRRKTSLAGS